MKRVATRRTRTRCHDSTCYQACRCTRSTSDRRRYGSRSVSSDCRRIARNIFHITTPRILSGLNRIRHRNALMSRAKYLLFY